MFTTCEVRIGGVELHVVSRGCSRCTGVKEVGVDSSVSDAGTSKSLVTSSVGSELTEDWMDQLLVPQILHLAVNRIPDHSYFLSQTLLHMAIVEYLHEKLNFCKTEQILSPRSSLLYYCH